MSVSVTDSCGVVGHITGRHDSHRSLTACPLYHNMSADECKACSSQMLVQLATSLTATGTHVPYGIIQCYLPSGTGDIPGLTAAEAGT